MDLFVCLWFVCACMFQSFQGVFFCCYRSTLRTSLVRHRNTSIDANVEVSFPEWVEAPETRTKTSVWRSCCNVLKKKTWKEDGYLDLPVRVLFMDDLWGAEKKHHHPLESIFRTRCLEDAGNTPLNLNSSPVKNELWLEDDPEMFLGDGKSGAKSLWNFGGSIF